MTQNQEVLLSQLHPGQEARVVRVGAMGGIRKRLIEMGFIKGAHLRIERLAPLGDPMELVIKGYHLSLRREEGACITVVLEAERPPHPEMAS